MADLRAMIADFVGSLSDVSDGRVIANRWRGEMRKHRDRTPATRKLYVSKYRAAIRDRFGLDALALRYVRQNSTESAAIRDTYKARVATAHRALIAVPRWRDLVAAATAILEDEEAAPLDLAVALCVVTGRRTVEVCSLGWVSPKVVDEDLAENFGPGHAIKCERWRVMFEGQAKIRDSRSDAAYPIPTLAPASTVIEAWRRMRATEQGSAWSTYNGAGFTRHGMAPRMAEACYRLASPYWPDGIRLTPKALRALYAEIAYDQFGGADVSKSAFFADILGHQRWDLETSLSYFVFHLGDETKAAEALEATKSAIVEKGAGGSVGQDGAQEPEQDPGNS